MEIQVSSLIQATSLDCFSADWNFCLGNMGVSIWK